MVMQMRPMIECKRHEIVKIPSVLAAEFEKELDQQYNLKTKLEKNISNENALQREKFMKLKEKYDKEGIEYIGDEMDIGKQKPQDDDRKSAGGKDGVYKTRSGKGVKPGERRRVIDDMASGNQNNINMGGDNDNSKNPFTMIINQAKK